MCCASATSTVAAKRSEYTYSVFETRGALPAASQAQAGGATTLDATWGAAVAAKSNKYQVHVQRHLDAGSTTSSLTGASWRRDDATWGAAVTEESSEDTYSVIETRGAPPARAGGATTPLGAPPSLRRVARTRTASLRRREQHQRKPAARRRHLGRRRRCGEQREHVQQHLDAGSTAKEGGVAEGRNLAITRNLSSGISVENPAISRKRFPRATATPMLMGGESARHEQRGRVATGL